MANKCYKCGECCRNFEMFLKPCPENRAGALSIIDSVGRAVGVSFGKIRGVYVRVDGDCLACDTEKGRCKIYKDRPERCKTFYCGRKKDGEETKTGEKG